MIRTQRKLQQQTLEISETTRHESKINKDANTCVHQNTSSATNCLPSAAMRVDVSWVKPTTSALLCTTMPFSSNSRAMILLAELKEHNQNKNIIKSTNSNTLVNMDMYAQPPHS
jgi:hypothetical protein